MPRLVGMSALPLTNTDLLFENQLYFQTAGPWRNRINTPLRLTGGVEATVQGSLSCGEQCRNIDIEKHALFGGFNQLQRGPVRGDYSACPGVTA